MVRTPRWARLWRALGDIQTVQWIWQGLVYVFSLWGWQLSSSAIFAALYGTWARLREGQPLSTVVLLSLGCFALTFLCLFLVMVVADRVQNLRRPAEIRTPLVILPPSRYLDERRSNPLSRLVIILCALTGTGLIVIWVAALLTAGEFEPSRETAGPRFKDSTDWIRVRLGGVVSMLKRDELRRAPWGNRSAWETANGRPWNRPGLSSI